MFRNVRVETIREQTLYPLATDLSYTYLNIQPMYLKHHSRMGFWSDLPIFLPIEIQNISVSL